MRQHHNSYDLLIFDLDGVLLDFHAAEEVALSSAFQLAGVPFREQWLDRYREVNIRFWKAFEAGTVSVGQIKQDRFPVFLAEIGVDADPVAMSRDYLTGLARCSTLLGDPLPLLNQLGERFPMALVTNGLKSVQEPRLVSSGLVRFFSPIVISEDVGVAKPHPAIFGPVLDHHPDVKPDRILMIGDSLSSDIAGANAAGMDSCWFNPNREQRTEKDPRPTHTISRLEHVLDILS